MTRIRQNTPKYSPITPEWQKRKSFQLGIPYIGELQQHTTVAGELLSNYIPWQQEEIVADGNCFFRCISTIITGSQSSFEKLRQELCRYIVTEGSKEMLGYFFTKFKSTTTPLQHLKSTSMITDSVWATDVEIVAMSVLLRTDIYIAQKRCRNDGSDSYIFWLRYHGSVENDQEHAIYITNFDHHYEPVIRLIDSPTPSYIDADSFVDCMVIDD